MVVSGFKNGILRVLALNEKGFTLVSAQKVHKEGIKLMRFSQDGSKLAVVSPTGNIFFFVMESYKNNELVPFCLYDVGDIINDLKWN